MLNNHYYEKLNSCDKQVYDVLLEGFFSRKEKIKVSAFPSYAVMNALNCEHPELYFVNLKEIVQQSSGVGQYVLPEYIYNIKECSRLEKVAKSLAQACMSSDEELTVRKLHNYLVRQVRYDKKEQTGNTLYIRENHTMAGVFLRWIGVCEGIAKAFAYLLTSCCIDNVCISGKLNGQDHMWNVVNVKGYNYHIDVTSDICCTDKKDSKPCYFYYLVTDGELRKEYVYDEQFNCFQTQSNPFYCNNRVFFNKSELIVFLKGISRFQKVVFFKYMGNDMDEREMFNFVARHLPLSLISCSLACKHNKSNTIFYFMR